MTRRRGETWRRRRLLAAGYDAAVRCGPVVRVGARLLWGYDVSEAWAAIGELATAAPGTIVLDMPSGGGVALRGLRPGQDVRYVAADISATMLLRARAPAKDIQTAQEHKSRGGIGLVQADIAAVPFADGTVDLCLSYNGLHCLLEPGAAVREYARVLRPGGALRGTAVVAGTGRRHDAVTWVLRRVNAFGPSFRTGDLDAWLRAAGFCEVRVTCSGAVAAFSALRPGH
ncbi:MAG TPA: class I SAM-dependent methyltransferase [Streptosporangiaceae bacterium]|nr:class I SAM-dependent methyltransferase [Streptosporangiaceae bacterium]